jgi:hypothetical protein
VTDPVVGFDLMLGSGLVLSDQLIFIISSIVNFGCMADAIDCAML